MLCCFRPSPLLEPEVAHCTTMLQPRMTRTLHEGPSSTWTRSTSAPSAALTWSTSWSACGRSTARWEGGPWASPACACPDRVQWSFQRLQSERVIAPPSQLSHPYFTQGSIPYVPYLRAPYYIWIGQIHQTGRECICLMKLPGPVALFVKLERAKTLNLGLLPTSTCMAPDPVDAAHENKVDRPALFPPTFLYTQSWEDPEPDMKVRV